MNNKVGLHVCYWSGTGIENDMDGMIRHTAKSGADLMELNPIYFINLDKNGRAEFRRRIEDQGMHVTANSGLITRENDISSPDSAVREAGFRHCGRLLEACSDMGSPYWSGLMHSAWCLRPDADDLQGDRERTWERSVRSMRRVARMAEEHGVVCALEVVNRYEHFLFNTAADGVAFCEQVGSPYCKLLLDVFHMAIEEDNMADAVGYAVQKGQLASLHIGETNRRIPTGGPSNIKWNELRQAVLNSGYDGPMIIEPLAFATSGVAAKACLWRNVSNPDDMDQLDIVAKRGVDFVRSLGK